MNSIGVHLEVEGVTQPIGRLYSSVRRGTIASTFAYDQEYVGRRGSYAIDPALPLSAGAWPVSGALPGAFSDAAPDRWGRNLISKRLRAEAAAAGHPMRMPDDRDYLLGVSDVTRQGALRFTVDGDEVYQHPSNAVPKLIALPKLMRAAESVASDVADDSVAVKVLLDAGTGSLGGARPKASVQDDNRLMIAKFSHPSDEWNVMAWEATALQLAARAGVTVPPHRLLEIDGSSVLLLDRFDREGDRRRAYLSGMTVLESADGATRDYLELADALTELSSSTSRDLRQLWRRIAFSVAIHNTDDHLRNHGFIREGSGWRLSPAFDLNPDPDTRRSRMTTIAGAPTARGEVTALLSSAATFALDSRQAHTILCDVIEVVSQWRSCARQNGISVHEIRRFEPAFQASLAALQLGADAGD